tara:strand:+ start:432 stop:617 length:186 start_codon:yes stop_codon:yes gene_type:complete
MSKWITQINIRLDAETEKALQKEAEIAGSTRSQIARESIRKELRRRQRGRQFEKELEKVGN